MYSIDSYMQFNRCLFIKQGKNIRSPEQSKNTERKKRKSFFLSLCKKVQLVSVLSFSLKNAFKKKHFCSNAGNQLLYYVQQLMCLFLFVNIVHVCVICLTQISMHQSNICYTNECIKSTAVSYICNYILLHQYFFYQKCFECVT